MKTEKLIELASLRRRETNRNQVFERAVAFRLQVLKNSMTKAQSIIEFAQDYEDLQIRAIDTTNSHNYYSTVLRLPQIAMYKNRHIVPYVVIHDLETIPLSYCLPNTFYIVGSSVNISTPYFTIRDGKLMLKIPKILQQSGLIGISRVSCKVVLENPRDWTNPVTGDFFDFRDSDFPMPDEYINRFLYPDQYAEATQQAEQEEP